MSDENVPGNRQREKKRRMEEKLNGYRIVNPFGLDTVYNFSPHLHRALAHVPVCCGTAEIHTHTAHRGGGE